MRIVETKIPDLLLLEPDVFGDDRGFFLESYNQQRYVEAGINHRFVQDNHSRSSKGVLRGLHCQKLFGQGKLVRVSRGEVFDVAVDIRLGSPTFGQWYGTILNDTNHRQVFIPPGFAHGFCVLSDIADFEYKCTEFYHPEDEIGLRWDDRAIGIDWPIDDPILSERDRSFPTISEVDDDYFPVVEQYV